MLNASDVAELRARLGERLIAVDGPQLDGQDTFAGGLNPFAIEDDPGAFHTTGWFGAYDAGHSRWAVAAENTADLVAAVEVAARRRIGLVVKGTGHDYLGRSSAPDSLLVWTHRMRQVTLHDAFTPAGSEDPGFPAVTVQAGARWLEVYQAATSRGRFVQGGGCTSVGAVGGFTQGGGFGSFSRRYGTAAGNVVELEVVTASGKVLVANALQHADLFWALRGGGGGTFGVVSSMTFRTYPLPTTIAVVQANVRAAGDQAFHRLVDALVRFVPEVCDATWGEQLRLNRDNSLNVFVTAVDVSEEEARRAWEPFLGWVDRHPGSYRAEVSIMVAPFRFFWSPDALERFAPGSICRDTRPGAPAAQFWWATNQGEVSQYLHAYRSRWLPARSLVESPGALAATLVEASRTWGFALHLNKALWGAAAGAVARDRTTAINPAVFDAAALVIAGSGEQSAFPGVAGHEPDLDLAAERARRVAGAMDVIDRAAPQAGSYVNETDYFEKDWRSSFWGDNYARLLEVKRAYDPENLFRVHHGVGSDVSP